ncbi:hypothetical protein BWK59_07155 [Flavobacterium davisii]|uniref:Uncharacterized protein n=1 Tax=Flavobacterium davisii TaxID=2906077 RepID=A0A246GIN4_9FLAO|nr:hypothetical protein BWK59_07155 [Flavobacterium davisii]
MRNLVHLNLFFVGLPIILCLIGIIYEAFLIWGLVSTILTGLFQLIAGTSLLFRNPKNKYLQAYIIGVVFFFTLWFLDIKLFKYSYTNTLLLTFPPILAIYFTIIIYKIKE